MQCRRPLPAIGTSAMEQFDALVEDHSVSPVPDRETIRGWRVALVILGFNISLPAFLLGAQTGLDIGLPSAVLACAIAGWILFLCAALTASVSVRSRLTTYVMVQYSFGLAGARFVNFILATTLLGWFGVNAWIFAAAVLTAAQQLYGYGANGNVVIILSSGLIIATTVFGFKLLRNLAMVAAPLLFASIVLVAGLALKEDGAAALLAPSKSTADIGLIISAIIGTNMAAITAMPDIARFVAGRRQAIIGMFLAYALGFPAILSLAAMTGVATGQSDLMAILLGFGLGLPALLILFVSAWGANSANIYSAGLSLAATFPRIDRWILTVAAGAVGILLAIVGLAEFFMNFLLVLGVVIPPIASVYIIDSFTRYRSGYDGIPRAIHWPAFLAWGGAALIGVSTATGIFQLTAVPSFDSIIAATLFYGAHALYRAMLAHEGGSFHRPGIEKR